MSTSTIFSIAGFVIALVLDLASLILILWIFYLMFKTSREVSPLLLMNLIAWVTVCIAALPYYLYMIATWHTNNNGYWIFWIGAPSQCLFAAVPTSVFMLTLDRIYCVYWPIKYQKQAKSVINITCVILIVTSVVANMLADLNELAIPEETSSPFFSAMACQAFGCLQTRQKTVFIAGRLGFSFVNIVAQSIFLYKLIIIRKSGIGPYNNVLAGIDALITSLTYTKVLQDTKAAQIVMPNEAFSKAVNASKATL
ncbi:hypothetical protein DdX_15426 [Ditylenchus destructor]|uniref:Uncharacterized protein n=1 Tax=Ditylenchus destructor TaxID=166010 RepID=A0AAD4MQD1_9BILA|nr:hypothetical protein DdX_15426 [Ditylenchus destructor]